MSTVRSSWFAIAVALTLVSVATLQQVLACMLGRAGMASTDLLRGSGLVLLAAVFTAELAALWRGRRRAVSGRSSVRQ